MKDLILSGRIVDLILVYIALEAAVVTIYHRRTGKGIGPKRYLTLLLPGLFIFLALKTVYLGAPWYWTALWLLASLGAHLTDLRSRWRRA